MAKATAVPRFDRAVKLGDGRSVAYCEWGNPEGRPVVLLHGMPGSRLFCPDEDATDAEGVRLITIDRPGYGGSDPHPGRTLLGWVDDFVELAELIELPACPVIGWSSGGPYAMACAMRVPDRVTSVGLAASDAPVDEVPGGWDGLPPEVRKLAELLRRDPDAAHPGIEERCRWYADDWESMFDPQWSVSRSGDRRDPDEDVLEDPRTLEAVKRWMEEGARQGSTGYVEDWIAQFLPWGFSPSQVERDVHVWWGDGDVLIDRASTEYLAAAIPRAALVVFPGEGHLFPVNHWAEMLRALS